MHEQGRDIEPQKNDEYWQLANQILDAVFDARTEGIRDNIYPPSLRYHQVNFIIKVLHEYARQKSVGH